VGDGETPFYCRPYYAHVGANFLFALFSRNDRYRSHINVRTISGFRRRRDGFVLVSDGRLSYVVVVTRIHPNTQRTDVVRFFELPFRTSRTLDLVQNDRCAEEERFTRRVARSSLNGEKEKTTNVRRTLRVASPACRIYDCFFIIPRRRYALDPSTRHTRITRLPVVHRNRYINRITSGETRVTYT